MYQTVYQIDGRMTIERHSTQPIFIVTMTENFDFGDDMRVGDEAAYAILDEVDTRVYWIVDILRTSMSFERLLNATNSVASGQEPLFKHPNIKQVILVSESRMIQLAAKGLDSEIFGHLAVKVFDTVEDAIHYASA